MSDRKLIRYRCTQSELYTVCEMGWDSFQQHVDDFTAMKSYFNITYGTAAIAEVRAAQLLPDVFQRTEVGVTLRIQLGQAAANARRFEQRLKFYILDAYAEEFTDAKLNAAGLTHYTDAVREDFESIKTMLTEGNTFIINNEVDLSANGNMPATFPTEFSDSRDNYQAIYALYLNAEESMKEQTEAKINANNAIYVKLLKMFKIGQFLYSDLDALRSRFVFETCLELVSNRTAGLKGIILNGNTSGPLPGVALSLYEGTLLTVDPRYVTTSVAEGVYDFGTIASGSYTLKMECVGFETKTEVVEIEVGVVSSKSFTLVGV